MKNVINDDFYFIHKENISEGKVYCYQVILHIKIYEITIKLEIIQNLYLIHQIFSKKILKLVFLVI
jgi:hypothetical protein